MAAKRHHSSTARKVANMVRRDERNNGYNEGGPYYENGAYYPARRPFDAHSDDSYYPRHEMPGYKSNVVGDMTREFSSGKRGEMDEMVQSNDGLFPEKVVMRDFPNSGYASNHTPYDGIRGVDDQIDSDSRTLQTRRTKGSF